MHRRFDANNVGQRKFVAFFFQKGLRFGLDDYQFWDWLKSLC